MSVITISAERFSRLTFLIGSPFFRCQDRYCARISEHWFLTCRLLVWRWYSVHFDTSENPEQPLMAEVARGGSLLDGVTNHCYRESQPSHIANPATHAQV